MATSFIEPDWKAPPRVRALVTTRVGGTSSAPWDSLNLGDHVGDAADAVQSNRARLRDLARLPADPAWLKQVHGTVVADLDSATPDRTADAAVTTRRAMVCAVLTADCLPVFMASDDGRAVAIAHAGWRGLASGVIETALQSLRHRIPAGTPIHAWLGPAISAEHFEVGEDVRGAFLRQDAAAAAAFTPNAAGRWQCDLYLLARQRLRRQGIEEVAGGGLCTYADARRFFSHRRDVQHRGLAATGRMASLLWLT